MGSGEEAAAQAKASKSTPPSAAAAAPAAAQEAAATPMYSEWGPPLQAFYSTGAGAPPQAFFSPSMAGSPSPHPYMWGGQHFIPAYGTPIPYYAHGGMYAHPSMAAGTPYSNAEAEGKEQGSAKKKARVGSGSGADVGPGKSGDGGKVTSGSADEGSADEDATQSEYEGSSDGKDESDEPQSFGTKKSTSGAFADGEASQPVTVAHCSNTTESSYNGKGQPASKLPVLAPGRAVLPGPATNLNIGMDLWTSPHADAAQKARPNAVNIAPAMASSAVIGRKGTIPEQQWMHDERELKRQKRKQSNRESARRSRLRKQQECEELAKKVEQLNGENSALRNEIDQLNKTCKDLESENASIMEELKLLYGPGVASAIFQGVNGDSSNMSSVDGESCGQVHL